MPYPYGLLVGLWAFEIGSVLLVLQGVFANRDGFLTQGQIRKQGYKRGISFFGHIEMWSDLLAINFLVAFVIGTYAYQWQWHEETIAIFLGLICARVINVAYAKDSKKIPGCHALAGQLTDAGWLHLMYQGLVIGVLLLFYFGTVADKAAAITVSAVLVAHLAVGAVYMPLYLKRPINLTDIIEALGGGAAIGVGLAYNLLR